MALEPYLRRHSTTNSRDEYLYLTVERMEPNWRAQTRAPQLPGNESDALGGGTNSTNFIINLGSWQMKLNVSGYLIPVDSSEFPDLSSPDIHILNDSQTISSDQSGKDIREALYQFAADQSSSDFDKIEFAFPDWSSSQDPKVFEGNIMGLNSTQIAGEEDQYAYNFQYTVGDV